MKTPGIGFPGEADDFHDSSLVDFQVTPHLDRARVILATPDESGVARLWQVTCSGVLHLQFETLGDGRFDEREVPLEIYSVYEDHESDERARWVERLLRLGVPKPEAEAVHHIVFASSFQRGWGRNEALEGIGIICRWVLVERAPQDYRGTEYLRPRIEADPTE